MDQNTLDSINRFAATWNDGKTREEVAAKLGLTVEQVSSLAAVYRKLPGVKLKRMSQSHSGGEEASTVTVTAVVPPSLARMLFEGSSKSKSERIRDVLALGLEFEAARKAEEAKVKAAFDTRYHSPPPSIGSPPPPQQPGATIGLGPDSNGTASVAAPAAPVTAASLLGLSDAPTGNETPSTAAPALETPPIVAEPPKGKKGSALDLLIG